MIRNTCILLFLAPLLAASALADGDSTLYDSMEELNGAYRTLIRTDDHAKGAALARKAQTAVAKALGEIPGIVAKMPEGAARDMASASYRHRLGALYVCLCEVEQAFLKGDKAKLEELVASLKQMKKDGHNEFMEE